MNVELIDKLCCFLIRKSQTNIVPMSVVQRKARKKSLVFHCLNDTRESRHFNVLHHLRNVASYLLSIEISYVYFQIISDVLTVVSQSWRSSVVSIL